jgi:ABC-type transporter Mla subunit MlaD
MDSGNSKIVAAFIFGGVIPVAVGLAVDLLFPSWRWVYTPFHSAVEAVGLFAGVSLALLLLLQQKRAAGKGHYLFVASGLLGMGILDAFHSSLEPGSVFVWLHSIALLTGGLLFSLKWAFSNLRAWGNEGAFLPWFVAVFAVAVGVYSISFPEHVPIMLIGEDFTPAAILLNALAGLFFVAAAVCFAANFRENRAVEDIFFVYFCLLNGIAGLLFPFSEPWGGDWWIMHMLRLLAYVLMLAMMYRIFKALTDRQIAEAANVIAASAGEILALTTQLASVSAETAASVSETTSTVEEVRQTAQLSAEKSKNVSDTAQKSAAVAKEGSSAVKSVVEGMDHIGRQMESVAESVVKLSEQTQAIGEIIAMVGDLAQQSNLLAVNAAIEASKAGEHGKGFTVVAQEIKSLADQSKQATGQVRGILGDIQKATSATVMAAEQVSKAVETGSRQSAESGETITKLMDGMEKAAQSATQIAASSQQQLAGMEQVAMAMENIKQATQQSMTGMKQAEQAAHNLNELGQKLKELLGENRKQPEPTLLSGKAS